jgi:molybdenum cofactor biosynthesis protein MoaC
MVDVSHKEITQRAATAVGQIIIPPHAYKLIMGDSSPEPSEQAPIADASRLASKNDSAAVQERDQNISTARQKGKPGKGDVLATAQLAGIMAAKRTSDLIPLCHPLPITHVEVVLKPSVSTSENSTIYSVKACATVRTASRTGVEMEALTAANVALLTIWDMLKAVAGQDMMIQGVCVLRKEGGASGLFERTDIA